MLSHWGTQTGTAPLKPASPPNPNIQEIAQWQQ